MTASTIITDSNLNDAIEMILRDVQPDFGLFDHETSTRWHILRDEIRTWLREGDWSTDPATVSRAVVETLEHWGAEITAVTE